MVNYSWWLNQPIAKIFFTGWFPKDLGWKFKKMLEVSPPSQHLKRCWISFAQSPRTDPRKYRNYPVGRSSHYHLHQPAQRRLVNRHLGDASPMTDSHGRSPVYLPAPWKINMEPKHGSLVQMIVLSLGWFLGKPCYFSGVYMNGWFVW